MPNVTVTMLQTRRGEDGTWWTAGSSYSATEAFARELIVANLATGTLPVPDRGIDALGRPVGESSVSGDGLEYVRAMRLRTAGAVGDSMMAGTSGIASSPYTQVMRNGIRLFNRGNFAVGGKRLDEFGPQRASVLATDAAIIISGGGVNDVVQGKTLAQTNADWVAHITELRDAGRVVIDVGMPPTNNSADVNAYVAHEIWRKLYCYRNGIRHADVYRTLAQGNGSYRSGMVYDPIHWNVPGAALARAEIERVLFDDYADQRPLLAMTDTPSGYNAFLTNAVSFAGGGALPNNWFASGSGGTYSVTPADSGDLGNWLRCTMSAGTNVGFTGQAVTLASLGWSIGDRIAIGFRARSSSMDGAMTINVYWGGITPVGGNQPMYIDQYDSITHYSEAVIGAGTTINVNFHGSGTGWFEINRPIVINLTKLGLV